MPTATRSAEDEGGNSSNKKRKVELNNNSNTSNSNSNNDSIDNVRVNNNDGGTEPLSNSGLASAAESNDDGNSTTDNDDSNCFAWDGEDASDDDEYFDLDEDEQLENNKQLLKLNEQSSATSIINLFGLPTRFDNNNKSNGSRNVQSNAAILSVDNVLNSISSIPVNGYSAEALSPASAFNPFDCVFTNRGRDNNYEGLEGLLDGLRLNANDNVEDEDNSGGGAAEEDGMDIDTRGESGVDDEKSAMDDSVHFDAGGNDMEEEEEERNDMEVEDEAVRNDDGAAAELNEIGVHEFVKSLAETENEEDDDYCDTLNYESDLDNTNQNLPSQMGFKRALEAAAAKPEPDIDEEEEEDDTTLQNEEESNAAVEQRDDTDTQGRGDDAGSVSQSLDMPFTQHQCRSEGCTECPQAATATETTVVTSTSVSAANNIPVTYQEAEALVAQCLLSMANEQLTRTSAVAGSNASAAAASSDGEATQALNQEDGEEDEMPSTSDNGICQGCRNLVFLSASRNKCDTCGEYKCERCYDPSEGDTCVDCLLSADEQNEDTTSSSAKGQSFESQIKALSDKYMYVSTEKQEKKISAFSSFAKIGSQISITCVAGTAIEAAMLVSSYLFVLGMHTENMINTTPTFITILQEEVALVSQITTKYQRQCPKLHDRDNSVSVVLSRMEKYFNDCFKKDVFKKDHKKSSSLKPQQITANINKVKKYFHDLATVINNEGVELGELDVDSLTGLPVIPWRNQDAEGVLEVVNDGARYHSRIKNTRGKHDRDVRRLIPLFGMYFCGKTKNGGYPAKNNDLLCEGNESIQVRARRKVDELASQVVFIYKWLVTDHFDLIKSHIPAEYLNCVDLHPPLNVNNILSVIEEMKVVLHACLTTNNITELSDEDGDAVTLYCLESPDAILASFAEGTGTNTYEEDNMAAEKKIMSILNNPDNIARCLKEYQAQLEDSDENYTEETWKEYEGRVKSPEMEKLWMLLDECRNQVRNANPKVSIKGKKKAELDLAAFKTQMESFMMKDRMLKKGIEELGIDAMLLNISENEWKNNKEKKQRNNAIAKIGTYLLKFMWDRCQGAGCNFHLINHPLLSSSADLDHETLKLNSKRSPSTIAKDEGIVALVKEVLKMKCKKKCKQCHDRGDGTRKFDVDAIKSICITSHEQVEHRSPYKVLLNTDGKDAITQIKLVLTILEISARDTSHAGTSFQTLRTITSTFFPHIVLDNLVNYSASYFNELVERKDEKVNCIITSLIAFSVGFCAEPECKTGDLRNMPPTTNPTWDHDVKKGDEISTLRGRNTILMLNELISWTEPLCFISDAKRTHAQQRGCGDGRCYNVKGNCNCKRVKNPKDAFPKKVNL